MIYMFLAEGFEETEAIATLDVLRRAELLVTTVGVGGHAVVGAHAIPVICDIDDTEFNTADLEMIILPGGMPGTLNLAKSPVVCGAIEHAAAGDHWICAICAAPGVLGRMGLLKGKRYTCYPGYEHEDFGEHCEDRTVRDGKIITGKGPGASIPFGLAIVEALLGKERRDQIEVALQ